MTQQIVKEDYHIPRWMDREIDAIAQQRDSTRSDVVIEALNLFLRHPTEIPKRIDGEKVRPGFCVPSDLDEQVRVLAATKRRKKSLVAIAALTQYLKLQKIPA